MGAGFERILDRIGASQKHTNPYQLIGTAVTIVLGLGSIFAWEAGNLTTSITAVAITIKDEVEERITSQRRLYDEMEKGFDKTWSKDAHVEFERRIDERNVLEQKYADVRFDRIGVDIDRLQAIIVPRAENDQRWKDQTEDIGRLERQLSGSLDRLAEHVNKSDDTNAQKFSDVDKGLHGYGLPDEVKDIQTQLRVMDDKLFHLVGPPDQSDRPKSSGQ